MDKVILKVTGIIVMVMGIFFCFTIIGLLWGIPLIIGGNKFMTFSNMTDEKLLENKTSLLCWSIFFLFFTVVGGILGLIFYLQLNGSIEKFASYTKPNNTDYLDELKKLKELYDNKAITKEEYEHKKEQILNR